MFVTCFYRNYTYFGVLLKMLFGIYIFCLFLIRRGGGGSEQFFVDVNSIYIHMFTTAVTDSIVFFSKKVNSFDKSNPSTYLSSIMKITSNKRSVYEDKSIFPYIYLCHNSFPNECQYRHMLLTLI